MWKVYVGNLDYRVRERELADEFRTYGNVRSVWVARNPPGYAFVEFDDRRDAEDSVSALDGKHGWRVEMSRKSVGGGGRSRAPYGSERCYDCGAIGHFARECRSRGSRYSHRRSPSPLYRRSDSHRHSLSRSGRDSSISPRRDRHRSYRERSSPRRKRERSRSLDSDGSEGRGHRSKVRRHSISPEHDKSDVLSPQRNEREKSRSPQNDPKREEHESSRSPEIEPDIREASPLVKEGSKSPPRERSGELGDLQKEGYKQNGTPQGEESDMEGDASPELRDDSRSPQADKVGSYADGDSSPILRDDSRSSLRDNVGSLADGDESPVLNRSPRPDNVDKVGTYAAGHSPTRNGSSGSKSPQEDNNSSYPEGSSAEEVAEQHCSRESE